MTDPICPPGTRFAAAVEAVRAGKASIADAVAQLLRELNDDEMLGLLDGDLSLRAGLAGMMRRYNEVPYEAGRVDRLGIPGIRFTDGPRGVVVGSSTAFPVAIARAATWDIDLEERIGDAIGAEARAQGANLFAGICINLAHAPGWGRAQESYGEEPTLLGAMGVALTTGVKPWVMSCVKHFALNSMEESRFRLDVAVEEDVLREVYLPHFRQVVDAGVDAVMSAYNSVNGEWAGQNAHLLTDILRDEWAFDGFVMTDFIWGLRDPVGSVAAGQDLEMPFRQQRARTLTRALADGRLAKADVERAASRLLTAQVRLALRARPTPRCDRDRIRQTPRTCPRRRAPRCCPAAQRRRSGPSRAAPDRSGRGFGRRPGAFGGQPQPGRRGILSRPPACERHDPRGSAGPLGQPSPAWRRCGRSRPGPIGQRCRGRGRAHLRR